MAGGIKAGAKAGAARRRPTQAERNEDARARLIGAAIAVLNAAGFAGATTQRIAKEAGLTTGALHHHFSTKADLLVAVLDHVSERILARLQEHAASYADGEPGVAKLVHGLWDVYGDVEYWATWEIIIGFRSDRETLGRLTEHRLATMETLLHPWLARHSASREARTAIVAIFELMLIAIRGLRLERFLKRDEAYFRRNLDLLAAMIEERLARLAPLRQKSGERARRRAG
jgi:AcrR family transcriptional regulator